MVKILYVEVLWEFFYVLLHAALLWYNKVREDLEGQCFKSNDMIQSTFSCVPCWPFEIQPNDLTKWYEETYRKHERFNTHRVKIHEYLGMNVTKSKAQHKEQYHCRTSWSRRCLDSDSLDKVFHGRTGYPIKENNLYLDNKSAILLEMT